MRIKSSVASFSNTKNSKIAVVISRYNDSLGNTLLENVLKTLKKHHVLEKNVKVFQVPGALEIPFAVKKLVKASSRYDAIITLGMVIKGNTYHFELVCNESYRALMDIAMSSPIPIIFGVLTVNTIAQAEERVSDKKLNKGEEFALSALEMISLNKKI